MSKKLLEQYGKYFISKFQDDSGLKFDIVKNDDEMWAVYIYSRSDFSEYFLRIDKKMIYIDGIVVQNEGIEYDDIADMDSKKIYKFLDAQAKILSSYLKSQSHFLRYIDILLTYLLLFCTYRLENLRTKILLVHLLLPQKLDLLLPQHN